MKHESKLRSQKIIDLLIEFSYLAIIFLVPLYFSVSLPTYNIFELSKLFIFKILVYLMLFLTVLKVVFYRSDFFLGNKSFFGFYSDFKKYYLVPLIFIIGLGFTLFFSANPWQSFFGSYDRQAGYLSYLYYILWLFLLVFNLKTIDNHRDNDREKESLTTKLNHIFVAASFSGFLVSIYGILQILGIDFLAWPEDPLFTRRTFSTLGQPNFLASWLLLVIPLSVYLIYKNRKFLIKFFYGLVLFSELICLFFTASRGAMLALILVGIVFIIYLAVSSKIENKNKFKLFSVLFIFFILAVSIFSFNNPGRLKSLLDINKGSMAARVDYYSAAVKAIGQKPFFGYGLDNGAQAFFPYYQSSWSISAKVGTITDRAHNLILDILINGGFFALVLFGLFYFHFFRLVIKNISNKKYRDQSLAIFLGSAAYIISLFFNFSLVATEIYFFMFFAVVLAIESKTEDEPGLLGDEGGNLSQISFLSLLVAVAIFCSIGLGISYEFRVLKADYYFQALYYNIVNKQYFTSFTLFDYVNQEKTNSINQNYYDRVFADLMSNDYPGLDDILAKKLIEKKLADLNKKLPVHNYQDLLIKGKLETFFGSEIEAEKYFKQISLLNPDWPETYVRLGDLFSKKKML